MIISNASLAGLKTAFSTAFKQAFDGAPAQFERVATVVPSTTGENNYAWLGEWPKLREWVGDRVIKNLSEHGYSLRNKTFEATVSVPREALEDDQYGIYSPMVAEMGRAAKTHPDELVFALLAAGFVTECYDGQYFFDTDHPANGGLVSNMQAGASTPWFLLDTTRALKPLIYQKRRDYTFAAMDRPEDEAVFTRREYRYGVDARCNVGYGFWQMAFGSKATLDAANYAAARAAMKAMKSDDGRPLGITPNLLVVPPSLESAARKLLVAETGTNGATNEWKGSADFIEVAVLA